VSHTLTGVFDDRNLVSVGGLVPVMELAEKAGLHQLAATTVTVGGSAGANPGVKVPALVAGMIAGADSIDDVDVLRHGGMRRAFTGVRAPTTLGTHLRAYRFGHVRQLDAVASGFLVNLTGVVPHLLDGASELACLDSDDTVRATSGDEKEGAAYG